MQFIAKKRGYYKPFNIKGIEVRYKRYPGTRVLPLERASGLGEGDGYKPPSKNGDAFDGIGRMVSMDHSPSVSSRPIQGRPFGGLGGAVRMVEKWMPVPRAPAVPKRQVAGANLGGIAALGVMGSGPIFRWNKAKGIALLCLVSSKADIRSKNMPSK
ncbi:uncharacterized protein MCYG_04826 [Microsporum canis CBS 113480]|uniref:Uncharacterized protein n=1 Tax=Arthroderma otae (strain ATCC MYA-4605 / CBS 113480) TaxID=554155 RepID=C5FQ54_ARTOC|nr:uncharacterized protein MCYG_04826 [Microsporum canis CBS 113480]EEQ32007.1 predicted protein [Microsporum canis CBS 113480]